MAGRAPLLDRGIGPWVPFVLCALLCAMVVMPGTGGLVTGLPAFFSFLPMVFFFMALFLNEIRKELAAILARLDQLGTETQRGREQRG